MIEVYALVSKVNGNIYVGMALNAQNRLKEHNSGKVDTQNVFDLGFYSELKIFQIGRKLE